MVTERNEILEKAKTATKLAFTVVYESIAHPKGHTSIETDWNTGKIVVVRDQETKLVS